jgi:hypothetical protein
MRQSTSELVEQLKKVETVQSSQVQVAVSSGPKDQGTVVSATLAGSSFGRLPFACDKGDGIQFAASVERSKGRPHVGSSSRQTKGNALAA